MAWKRAPMKSRPSKRWLPHEHTVAARAGDSQQNNAASNTKAEIDLSLVILTTSKKALLEFLSTHITDGANTTAGQTQSLARGKSQLPAKRNENQLLSRSSIRRSKAGADHFPNRQNREAVNMYLTLGDAICQPNFPIFGAFCFRCLTTIRLYTAPRRNPLFA